jgi:hypothetical protein
LEGQTGLYETIRLGMEKTVREALNTKGPTKSQITILDDLSAPPSQLEHCAFRYDLLAFWRFISHGFSNLQEFLPC